MEATYREARLGGADENKVTQEFVTEMMKTFKNQKAIHTRYAFEILLQMKAILKETPTLMDIPVPDGTHFTVCGDVHGQVRCSASLIDRVCITHQVRAESGPVSCGSRVVTTDSTHVTLQ